MRILIMLPGEHRSSPPFDRARYGRIVLEDEGRILLGPFPALGKGGRSKGARSGNWKLRGNDTPTGEYIGEIKRWHPAEVYGPNPVITLDPIAGNALKAKELGRSGLAIHGGRAQDNLWSTEGCVRVFDRHMAIIIARLKQLGITEINVTIGEF
jgi:hypothetical protein